MRDMPRTLRAALIGLVCSATFLPGAAHADRWSSPDDSGDVHGMHHDPEPAPCGTVTEVDGSEETNDDITRLRVRHAGSSVHIRARFRDLDPDLEQQLAFHIATGRGRWMLLLDRWENASGQVRVRTFLGEEPEEPDEEDVDECGGYAVIILGYPCRIGREIDLEGNVVSVAVPRSCLRRPGWVRVGLDAMSFVEPTDPDDTAVSVFSDAWGVSGSTDSWLPPYGPRVLAPHGAAVAPAADPDHPAGSRRLLGLPGGGHRVVR